MDIQTYRQIFGVEQAKELAKSAGTSYGYLKLCACGFRRPSYDKAKRLVEASGGVLDLIKLLDNPLYHKKRDEAKKKKLAKTVQ
jgi:predicted transcriptional regulator